MIAAVVEDGGDQMICVYKTGRNGIRCPHDAVPGRRLCRKHLAAMRELDDYYNAERTRRAEWQGRGPDDRTI